VPPRRERIGDGDAEASGEMVIAGARPAQGFVARSHGAMPLRRKGGDRHQGLDGLRHLGRRQAVIAVAALPGHGDQAGLAQLGEVAARGLGAHPAVPGQFARGQGPAVHEGGQDVGAGHIADEGRDFRKGDA
jgi:hypothetical protein